MNHRISIYGRPLSCITSYYEMVDFAHKYGFNVETINEMELCEPDLEFAKKLRKYADERDVKFTCVSVAVNLVGVNAKENIERAKRYADVAAILGSPYFHHTIALGISDPDDVPSVRELYIERGIAAVCEIYDYAKEIGVTTVHEDQGYIFNGVKNCLAIKEKSKRDTKIVVDFGNILQVDEKIEDFIPMFPDSIVNVHVKDYKVYPKGTYDEDKYRDISLERHALDDCELGEGVVDFNRAFEELNKIGYKGNISLECPTADDIEGFNKTISFLEKYL